MPDPFLPEDFRVLTPEAFDFVLNNELKRAMRSQNFLTLVLMSPRSEGRSPEEMVREVARLIRREVRETDLLSVDAKGRLSMVLLDADLQNSMRVIERLLTRLEHYQFAAPSPSRWAQRAVRPMELTPKRCFASPPLVR